MIKQNTTNRGFFGFIEKLVRLFPIIYSIARSLIKYTNYFEEDFFILKKIFKNKKINIIDVGASDGISALFFLRNLNTNLIYCYEPQKILFKQLLKLKKKFKNLIVFNYGLGKKTGKIEIYIPYFIFLGKKISLLTYSFPVKSELINQINLDFLVRPKVEKILIFIKKFKLVNKKIDLIKIDTNGSEVEVVQSLLKIIKRDKPILIIENNNIQKIYLHLKKYKYKKYFVINNKLRIHKNETNANIIFK